MTDLIHVSENCTGRGIPPEYTTEDGDSFTLLSPGDPWRHVDGCLGLSQAPAEFDAHLSAGTFDVDGQALEMRVPSSLRGVRSGFGNPNGEYPPKHGTIIRFRDAGVRLGRPARLEREGIDDRLSLLSVERLCLYRDPTVPSSDEQGDGAAMWADEPSDQLTINDVNIACCTYGLLSTTYLDATRIRALHTGRVAFPLYFAQSEEAGCMTASWYGTVSDCCFADGDGPVVIEGASHPWNFNNVIIVQQGRRRTHKPTCNLLWGVSHGRFQGGAIDSPGQLFGLSDGASRRRGSQIDADGMIVSGDGNVISTFFRDASGAGRANLRLTRGSSKNLVQCQFAGTKNSAVDLIIEEDCRDNVVHVMPGMSIVDRGTDTRFIGAEWAGNIDR